MRILLRTVPKHSESAAQPAVVPIAGSAGGADFEGDGHGDFRVQPYGHLVGTSGLDGSADIDGTLVQQGTSRGADRVHNVGRGDRTEQLAT
jgi:hypothetical protein